MGVRAGWCAPLVVLCGLALLAAACTRSGGTETASSTTGPRSTASPASTSADFGTLKDICQPGTPSGSPAQGVTPTSIKVGTFADPGFAGRPGLFQELFDASEVFTTWCNDHGGINGRHIDLDEHDSAVTNVKPEMTAACADDFFLVGGGAALDQDGVDARLRCLLPDIPSYTGSPQARGADLQVQPVPNGLTTWAIGDLLWLGRRFPASKRAVGVLAADIPAGGATAAQSTEAVEGRGWKIVYDDAYPPTGPATWAPYAVAIKSAGVKGLIWVGEPEGLAKFMQALADIDYRLDWVRTEANHYDKLLPTVGGSAVHDVYIRSVFWPFEKASENPATRQYLDLFAKFKPNGKSHAYLAQQSFSAWLLFAQAAKECGNDLTRRCVYDNARKVTAWTGGGLHATTDPRANRAPECFVVVEATPKGFTTPDIAANDGIYRCDPAGVYTLKRGYGRPPTLASVGRSLADLK